MCKNNQMFNIFRNIQKGLFLLVPYVSFFHGQVSFFNNAKINSDCRKMTNRRVPLSTRCCSENFYRVNHLQFFWQVFKQNIHFFQGTRNYDGSCSNTVSYFRNFEDDMALETSILAMCLTPILYICLLYILECKLLPKLLAKLNGRMPDNTDVAFEEQVKKVKHEIAFEASKVRGKIIKNPSEAHTKRILILTVTLIILQKTCQSKKLAMEI